MIPAFEDAVLEGAPPDILEQAWQRYVEEIRKAIVRIEAGDYEEVDLED